MVENLNWIPLTQWNNYYTFPTIGAIRQYIFDDEKNFKEKVARKVAGKWYIGKNEMEEWIDSFKETA